MTLRKQVFFVLDKLFDSPYTHFMRIAKVCAGGLVAMTLLWPVSAGTSSLMPSLPPTKPALASSNDAVYGSRDMAGPSSAGTSEIKTSSDTTPWQAGLAAWRAQDYKSAHKIFADLAKGDSLNAWGQSGAAFWAARAADRMDERRLAKGYLQLASQNANTFYGQLAAQILRKEPVISARNFPLLPARLKASVQGDSALVHAIIMQESRFNAKAKSAQGARGLMQVLPSTAKHVDAAYKGGEALYNDAYNVKIGSAYIKMIGDKPGINQSPFLILAAYNSGPYAVSKWLDKAPQDVKEDPLLLIESYPVSQTRAYIEKVMANMWAYDKILNKNRSQSLDKLAKSF